MADMVKRFNTPDCESGMHEFEPRYPPQYEINSLAVRPNFFCLKVILSLLLTFSGGVQKGTKNNLGYEIVLNVMLLDILKQQD